MPSSPLQGGGREEKSLLGSKTLRILVSRELYTGAGEEWRRDEKGDVRLWVR
jgi:hypothetical protein